MSIDSLILRIKRGESAPYRVARQIARTLASPSPPRVPAVVRPALRALYELYYVLIVTARWWVNFFLVNPLFQGRCASFGRDVTVERLPFVSGHVEIHIGDHVRLGGGISIISGRFLDTPKLVIKDHVQIGWNVLLVVNRGITIEEHAMISHDCRIFDSDGHRREADLRAQDVPLDPRDIRPVRICRNAWIGNGAHVMKGVTVGEGAIVGANSVVITSVPAYALSLGNPAEVFFPNAGRPAGASPSAKAGQAPSQRTSAAPQE